MRFLSGSIGVMVLICASVPHRSVADEKSPAVKPPDGAALMRAEFERRAWLTRVKSMHLKGTSRYEKTLPGLMKDQQEVQRRFNPGKNPDPLEFRELLPGSDREFECSFDETRVREDMVSRAQQVVLSRDIRVWDGTKGICYSSDPFRKREDFQLDSKPNYPGTYSISHLNYLRVIPWRTWGQDREKVLKSFMESFGTPEDFIYVGDEEFHDVECHVLLSSRGNQSNRYYFKVEDGRWYGAKEGIIAVQDRSGSLNDFRAALEKFLGREVRDMNLKSPEYQKILASLHTLSQDEKERWCRIKYPYVKKHYPPVQEYWFSDYRDSGEGRVVPFAETELTYTHESTLAGEEDIFLYQTRTVTISELEIDEPLREDLLDLPPTKVGAHISDRIHKPPLYYEYKDHFTDDEWNFILRKGRELEEQQEKKQQRGKR